MFELSKIFLKTLFRNLFRQIDFVKKNDVLSDGLFQYIKSYIHRYFDNKSNH